MFSLLFGTSLLTSNCELIKDKLLKIPSVVTSSRSVIDLQRDSDGAHDVRLIYVDDHQKLFWPHN